MTMAKQNTKRILRKNISKKKKLEIANRLEQAVQNVSKKNIYFVVGDNTKLYSVINGKTKKAEIVDIPIGQAAYTICSVLNKAPTPKIIGLVSRCKEIVDKHSDKILKHINDLYFYNYTLNTTNDLDKIIVVQSRKDISLLRYYDEKRSLVSSLHNTSIESIDYKKL